MIIAPERGKAACKCLLQTISIASVDSQTLRSVISPFQFSCFLLGENLFNRCVSFMPDRAYRWVSLWTGCSKLGSKLLRRN